MKELHTYLHGYPALHLHGPTLCLELADLCGSLGIPPTPPNLPVVMRCVMDALDHLAGAVQVEIGPTGVLDTEGY